MSEKLFRFLLSELEIIRIRCTICLCVVEMGVVRLRSGRHRPFACPSCGKDFSSDALDKLGDAIDMLKATGRANSFEVEFVLPDPPP